MIIKRDGELYIAKMKDNTNNVYYGYGENFGKAIENCISDFEYAGLKGILKIK